MKAESGPALTAAADARVTDVRLGMLLAGVLLAIYGGLALSVDFPRAAIGIQSDEATYYMMGHSLAEDGDLTYRRQDLERVWKEFPSGPTGLFLKRGRDITDGGLMLAPPFVWYQTQADPDSRRLYYGKSFIYPLVAAPFVEVFGTNGFLVLHALLLALVTLCAYLFLHARAPAAPAALLAGAFVMATVVPVYFVWITPELFNFSLGALAYFCWLYKEVAPRDSMPRWLHWTAGSAGDITAAVLLGMATFSKPSNALLFAPIGALLLWRRQWTRGVIAGMVFVAVSAGLFGINTAISGEWNYQGGDRRTFYWEFPFQTPQSGFDVGMPMARDEAQADVILQESVFWTNFFHNLKWYFVGRYSGLLAYFFPAVFAMILFLAGARRRPLWQWLVLASGLAQIVLFIVSLPYTWFGGGGSVGNRYFMGAYGIFLFLFPAVSSIRLAVVPWIFGGLFTAKLVLNPFTSSFSPGVYAESGPLRLLPVELSNVNDLPINTERSDRVVTFPDDPHGLEGRPEPGYQIYFLDRNAYRDAEKSFWVRGDARTEFLFKTDRPMKRVLLTFAAGAVATRVEATVDGHTQELDLPANGVRQLAFAMGPGYPYMKTEDGKPRFVWQASISSSDGFVPLFVDGSSDTRFLGVRVRALFVD